jgi:hypothetical protein
MVKEYGEHSTQLPRTPAVATIQSAGLSRHRSEKACVGQGWAGAQPVGFEDHTCYFLKSASLTEALVTRERQCKGEML